MIRWDVKQVEASHIPDNFTSTSNYTVIMFLLYHDSPTKVAFQLEPTTRNRSTYGSQVSGDENFCTVDQPCGVDQGDCDFDNQCSNGLKCGDDNCPAALGFQNGTDCCGDPCQGFDMQSNTVKTFNYPYFYGFDYYCYEVLTTSQGSTISLEIVDFVVSIMPTCQSTFQFSVIYCIKHFPFRPIMISFWCMMVARTMIIF